MEFNPRIGDVYLMEFVGDHHVQRGIRPGIVYQNNQGNTHSPNIIAIPLTSSIKKLCLPTHVLISSKDSGLIKDSVALCENTQIVPKERILKYITTLQRNYMALITKANLIATGGLAFMSQSELMDIWKTIVIMNGERAYVQ